MRKVAIELGFDAPNKLGAEDLAYVWKSAAAKGVLASHVNYGRFAGFTERFKSISRSAASSYLAGVFGFLPLITLGVEVPRIIEIFNKMGDFAQRGQEHGKIVLDSAKSITWDPTIFKAVDATVRAKLVYSVNAGSISSVVMPFGQLGLTHFMSTAWNLVPMSWLLDIFDQRIKNQMKAWDVTLSQAFIGADYYLLTAKTEMYLSDKVLVKLGWIPVANAANSNPRLTWYLRRLLLGAPISDGILPPLKSNPPSLGQLSTVGALLTTKSL